MQGFLESQGVSREQKDQVLNIIAGVGFKVSAMAHVQPNVINPLRLGLMLAQKHANLSLRHARPYLRCDIERWLAG